MNGDTEMVLRLPHLTSLDMCYVRWPTMADAMVRELPPLRSLALRRVGGNSEAGLERILNAAFDETCSTSLESLHLDDMWTATLASFTGLTHLSLTQMCAASMSLHVLATVARLPRLRSCEIDVSGDAARMCVDLHWWRALVAVRALSSFTLRSRLVHRAASVCAGVATLLQAHDLRLRRIEIDEDDVLSRCAISAMRGHPHIRDVRVSALEVCDVEQLATLPQLELLEVKTPIAPDAVARIAELLVRLRSVRLHNTRLLVKQRNEAEHAFMSLVRMPCLATLVVSGWIHINKRVLCKLRARLRSRSHADAEAQRCALGVFDGLEPSARSDPRRISMFRHLHISEDALRDAEQPDELLRASRRRYVRVEKNLTHRLVLSSTPRLLVVGRTYYNRGMLAYDA